MCKLWSVPCLLSDRCHSIRTHMDEVWDALADPDTRVVAQIAPAVRVAVGDHYGLTKGKSVMGKIVNALHRMGFDEVYDTTFSADLTIMEERPGVPKQS